MIYLSSHIAADYQAGPFPLSMVTWESIHHKSITHYLSSFAEPVGPCSWLKLMMHDIGQFKDRINKDDDSLGNII